MTLKIQKSQPDGDCVVFTLSGKIGAEHLAELQRLFDLEADDLSIVLDMQDVKLVDRTAVVFLSRCQAQGITLQHCPAYVREWIAGSRAARLAQPSRDATVARGEKQTKRRGPDTE